MSIIQCACGMVMSMSADAPRHCCIRCGGSELRVMAMADQRCRTESGDGDHFGAAVRGVQLVPFSTPWTMAVAEGIPDGYT
jgi:hypothetical protein